MKRVFHKLLFLLDGLGFITNAVGKPKKLHPNTVPCTSLEELKVFVIDDMTNDLPKSHHFKSKLGVMAEISFICGY